MQKIIATTIVCAIVLTASSQSILHPPKPPNGATPPVETVIDLPALPVVPLTPVTPLIPETSQKPRTPEKSSTLPTPEIVGRPDDYKLFLKKNPAVRSVSWHNQFIIIRMKTGKKERYRLDDEQDIKKAEAKHGKLPTAPPPPPLPTLPLPTEKGKIRP